MVRASGAALAILVVPLSEMAPMLGSPRCGAKTRSGKSLHVARGKWEQAMPDAWRAAGSGAPRGNKNAVTHGYYTREAKAERQKIRSLVLHSRDLIRKVK